MTSASRQQIQEQARAEVADVLAEALWTILLRDGVLTTGSRPELSVVGENAQHVEKARL